MSDLFEQPDDAATPLTPQEMRELIPAHIAYRRELNEAEQENISRAQDWALGRRRDLPSEKFIRDLHRQMLGDVWRWAGEFRTSERNIGIPFFEIPVSVRQLLDDTGADRYTSSLRSALVQRYRCTYLTSGRDLLRMQVPREAERGPLVVANPSFGEPPKADPSFQSPIHKTASRAPSLSLPMGLAGAGA